VQSPYGLGQTTRSCSSQCVREVGYIILFVDRWNFDTTLVHNSVVLELSGKSICAVISKITHVPKPCLSSWVFSKPPPSAHDAPFLHWHITSQNRARKSCITTPYPNPRCHSSVCTMKGYKTALERRSLSDLYQLPVGAWTFEKEKKTAKKTYGGNRRLLVRQTRM
jgi:hypothetical protein